MNYNEIKKNLLYNKSTWLITGVAGFIGSHLLEFLISHDQRVIGLDNFFTGRRANLESVKRQFPEKFDAFFSFFEGDMRDSELCSKLCSKVDYILHHAAISSVPFSIENPIETNEVNIIGMLNLVRAASQSKVKRLVYASSSAVYGDRESECKKETDLVDLISPYGATKYINELCVRWIQKKTSFDSVGLRYFNVFGHRQDPNGPYSAVIPKWISLLSQEKRPVIYGTGETTRDFCYIDNVVQANILACFRDIDKDIEPVFNVATGLSISLNTLFSLIKSKMNSKLEPVYQNFRTGDILRSSASIEKIRTVLGYVPMVSVEEGIKRTITSEYH